MRQSCEFREDQFQQLFFKYQPLVLHLKQYYYLRDFDHDDWLQESRIALLKATKTYDPHRQTTFGVYYKRILKNHFCSLVRKQEAQKRKAQTYAIYLDERYQDSDPQLFMETANYEQEMIICETLENTQPILSKRESKVFREYVLGKEIEELAEELAETPSTVKSALDRSRRKLKKRLQYSWK